MMARSSSVSFLGLVSTSSGMRILPMSWSNPATPIARISLRAGSRATRLDPMDSTATLSECVVVY